MKNGSIFFCSLLILCSFVYAQNVEGTYESIIPNRSKNVVSISAGNKYEEVEYRMYNGEWKYKCTYRGVWSISGDTLISKLNEVDWHDGDTTRCRPQDDTKQPTCCFSMKFFYDEKSIWIPGPMTGIKYVYTKKK